MNYLQRLYKRPQADDLTEREMKFVQAYFEIHEIEVFVESTPVIWAHIDEVEVVKAPRASGVIGGLARQMVGDDRYHVGIYFSRHYEAVLPNVSFNVARHIVQEIAFYAPHPVRYKGVEGLSPLVDQ